MEGGVEKGGVKDLPVTAAFLTSLMVTGIFGLAVISSLLAVAWSIGGVDLDRVDDILIV